MRIVLLLLTLIAAIGCANGAGYTDTIDLAGDWQVQALDSNWRDLKVPGSLESQIADLRSYSGQAIYRKELPIPESWRGKQVLLKFGAVDWLADVSVNGEHVGAHEGGYTPFEFDITDQVKFAEWNDLQVTVTDATPDHPFGNIVFDEIPHGRQGWHGVQKRDLAECDTRGRRAGQCRQDSRDAAHRVLGRLRERLPEPAFRFRGAAPDRSRRRSGSSHYGDPTPSRSDGL